ncbi:hypothetical protein BH11BAC4_BH11BAC4_13410 [soil metagenome]
MKRCREDPDSLFIAPTPLCKLLEYKEHGFENAAGKCNIQMKKIIQLALFFLIVQQTFSQTAVPMAAQPGLVYTENFADIANWSNGFTAGNGASRFAAVGIVNNGSIPAAGKTTVSTATFTSGVSAGVQAGPQNIILLSNGTADNSSATAFDLLLNFSTVRAGTLSFDWASVNNSTGDRKSSLRIYASTDGLSFTELTGAAVLNFTNNISTNGTVSNISLPAVFDLSPTAVLRFYYHNGTGGTAGFRPKISIDNISITALTGPCSNPAAQSTALSFSIITANTLQGNFNAAIPASDQYLIVSSTNNNLTSYPVDGQTYLPGDGLGDGVVVGNTSAGIFNATGLSASTLYYFFIFAENTNCTGGPKYLTLNALTASVTTIAGLPTCSAPAAQASNLSYSFVGSNSIACSFTATAANEYLVLRSTAASLNNLPVDGQVYNPADVLGNAVVVQRNNAPTFNATGLLPNTAYYFYIFSLNSQNCINGPAYNSINPLNGIQVTLPLTACATPVSQPTFMILNAANNSITASFTASPNADDYLVIQSLSPTLSATPVNNTDYNPGNGFGGGTIIANSASTGFISPALTTNTTYYFFVFAANKNCTGGTKYLSTNPLKANSTTSNTSPNHTYFGNFHAHSDYSDGNKDNPGFTPADNYNYAMLSQCMDYLGISEHNHYSSAGNPGNHLATYHAGIAQANSFTSTHPDFIAMYGMEWGIISGGGHVVVYGDGMDNLFGWETGSGAWGSSSNYDVYVPKNTYTGTTGLFKVVNDNIATNTFASLAHPQLSDYNNLDSIAYDPAADNAITATAVESGPAASTNSTYSNPGSSMSYLWYYQTLLSKGYHLGPVIDHDNHYTTFGRTTYSRTAVIAPSLSRTELIKAMRNMHFYATQDCDSKVEFTINSNMMGSIVTDRNAPAISISISDATTATGAAVIKLMFGVPGSGSMPVKIASAVGGSFNYIDNNLPNLSTGYYYADISNAGSRIITSPIWYSRNDLVVLPVTLSSFTARKAGEIAQLNWTTEQELNSSHFIIERSADGINWNAVASITAAGNSNTHTAYQAFDDSPLNGTNYYRLKQVDRDGAVRYSEVRDLYFSIAFRLNISPNPATDFINISISATGTGSYSIELIDAGGKKLYQEKISGYFSRINTAGLSKGIYFVKLVGEKMVMVKKLVIQ